jgi:hypothetical protein
VSSTDPTAPDAAQATPNSQLEYLVGALAKIVAGAQGAPPSPTAAQVAPAPPAGLVGDVNTGQIVTHTYEGLDGKVSQHGVIVEVVAPGVVRVGWFAGVSGNISTEDLTAF